MPENKERLEEAVRIINELTNAVLEQDKVTISPEYLMQIVQETAVLVRGQSFEVEHVAFDWVNDAINSMGGASPREERAQLKWLKAVMDVVEGMRSMLL